MTKAVLKFPDIVLAAAPSAASFALSHIDKVAASAAAILGVVYLGLGVAIRVHELRERRKGK